MPTALSGTWVDCQALRTPCMMTAGRYQIRAFSEHVGGLGHLLMMGQGGHLDRENTVANLRLFSREVLPRLVDS